MKITVADFPNDAPGIARQWKQLAAFLAATPTDVLVLPEMVAAPAFWVSPAFDETVWREAVQAHEAMGAHLETLKAKFVLTTRPVERDGKRFNETFTWFRRAGSKTRRAKAWLPQQEGGWEATWFDRGEPDVTVQEQGELRFAFLICSELMVSTAARGLGKAGCQLIAVPRATGGHERWVVGTRMAAISAGAFVATANRYGQPSETFAGGGWIIDAEGEILAKTSRAEPFVTVAIDLAASDRAKSTYPRNVED